MPGESRSSLAELGLNVPAQGLYIREDVKMTCSSLLLGFVKKTFKDSHARLVDKLVERAHILESNFANERLQALRNVDPGERMGHGDIFIAPPPDYQPDTHSTPSSPPRYVSHSRSHSDPVVSPGFSSSSTLFDQVDPPTLSAKFYLEDKPISASAPQQNTFLLPATTYDGGLSTRPQRPLSVGPASPSGQYSDRMISLLPKSPRPLKSSPVPAKPPRVSYTPEEQSISFTIPFDPKSPFDRKSTSETGSMKRTNILEDIDVAIDEVFMYTLPATTYTTLPATSYSPKKITLPSTKYDPKHMRKDSVMPGDLYLDKELPPVPLKDEKFRRAT